MDLKRYIPIFDWGSKYTRAEGRKDLIAGLTVCAVLVPQGLAYAMLAGAPPIYGLYAGIFPLIIYAIFGSSRQLSVGPVAISSILVWAGISQVAQPGSEEYISLLILAGLLIGILQVLLSFLRAGFLVNFLSKPVIYGFTSAAAIIISVSQLKYLFKIGIPQSSYVHETCWYVLKHIQETHVLTFVICLSTIAFIVILKKINKAIPNAIIALILGVVITRFFELDKQGLDIVGKIPQGLPQFVMPDWSIENIRLVFPTVLTVTIINVVESIGIAKALESKHDYYMVRPNQELFAIGASKVGGAFFQSIPTSASFSRSAINNDAGARTGMASIITAVFIILTLLFLTPLFYYLPNAILAAIILVSVLGLFEYKKFIHLWKVRRSDFYMMLNTFLVTLIFGIEEGVLAGVVLSILMVLFWSSKPHIVELGKLPNTSHYRNINRFSDAIHSKDILIIRFDASLYFGNASHFRERTKWFIKAKGPDLKLFILDASNINDIDSTGMEVFKELITDLKQKDIQFYLSGAIGPVRDLLFKDQIMDDIGESNQFMDVDDAMNYYKDAANRDKIWIDEVLQTNVDKEELD